MIECFLKYWVSKLIVWCEVRLVLVFLWVYMFGYKGFLDFGWMFECLM